MIKPLKQTDYVVAKRLFQEVFDMSEEPSFVTAWRSRDQEASHGYWIADVLVGAAIVSKNRLEYIFMHDACRGKGTGTQLLQSVIAACPTIHLTPVDDPDVQRWYIKHGFRLSTEKGAYRIYARHTHDTRTQSKLNAGFT